MEYAKVKKFLDECVRDYREATKKRSLTNNISLCFLTNSGVLVYEGLEVIADIMGLEIKEKFVPGVNLDYEYSFVYDGVKFVSYEEERMERFKTV